MTGPELSLLERQGRGRNHLSVVLANGRPVLCTDTEMTGALVRAVLGL